MEKMRPLSPHERDALARAPRPAGLLMPVFGVMFAVAAVVAAISGTGWGALLVLAAVLALVKGILWLLDRVLAMDSDRDLAAGQKAVVEGVVAEVLLTWLEHQPFHSVRVRTSGDTLETFLLPDGLHERLRIGEPIEVSCLPRTRSLLSLKTAGVSWSLATRLTAA